MRNLGALNMSVGTSMALEKDAFSEVPGTSTFLVNLRTLVRNVMGSYSEESEITKENIIKDTKSDLTELARWLDEASRNRSLRFIVYYPSYKSLPSIYRHADLVSDKTRKPKAQARHLLLESVCDELYKQFPKQIERTDTQIPRFDGRGLIITHHVVDLTLTSASTRLKLLESHTGTVKPFTKWYTKLTGGQDLFYMPFNKLTIQIFGDKSTNFYSQSFALKKMIIDLAQGKKWNSGTTYSRVRSDINGLPAGISKAGLKLLL